MKLSAFSIRRRAAQRIREYDIKYGPGYKGSAWSILIAIDFIFLVLLTIVGLNTPSWGFHPHALIPVALAVLGVSQLVYQNRTGRYSFPITFGPLTLASYFPVKKFLESQLKENVVRNSNYRTDEFFEMALELKGKRGRLESKDLLFWMLNADRELRSYESDVNDAITKTDTAITRLGVLTIQVPTVTSLVKALGEQKKKLLERRNELAESRVKLEQQMTGTKQQFEALEKARLAMDSLRLFQTNEQLLQASEAAVSTAKQLCLEWDGKIHSMQLDTRALMTSLPEVAEVYQVTA